MLLTVPTKLWVCNRCNTERVSPITDTVMHNCPGFGMMSVPMVLEGEKSDVRMVEREDYIGDEVGINIVGGKAIMAAETRHADGRNDLVVFPGVAVGSLQI